MKFSDIPQFPKSNYQVNVGFDFLEEHIRHHEEEHIAPLNLNPDFQREHVWTETQQREYVEYVLRGGEVSNKLIFNCPGWQNSFRGPYVIVDGKQRLEAVRKFMRNDLRVFGHKKEEFEGKVNIMRSSFLWCVYNLETRTELLELYLSINTRGTPHSSKEIKKVEDMLEATQDQELKEYADSLSVEDQAILSLVKSQPGITLEKKRYKNLEDRNLLMVHRSTEEYKFYVTNFGDRIASHLAK